MDAKLLKHNGALTLSINGALYPFTTYKPTEMDNDQLFAETVARTVKDMADRGVHVYFVPVYFGWTGPDDYDFAPTDKRINQVLAADPAAYLMIRVQAGALAPKWWMDANPEGVIKFGCGREPELPEAAYQTGRCPSLASSFWEEAGIPALQALAAHVRRQSYGERIIGYLPTAYNSNEWFFRSYDDLQVNDFSPAMQAAFTRCLRAASGLRQGHVVPDRMARGKADRGIFFHPDNPVVAFYRFMNELCAEKIVAITQALRKAHAPNRIIVGTFYGYSLGLANFYWLADSGHLALERLLMDDGPDFTCSPFDYFSRNNRDLPGGGFCWAQSTAPDSAWLAGKAYFGEDDFSPPDHPLNFMAQSADLAQDAELLKRNFVFTLCKGQLQWWYDLHGHWFEGKARLDAVQKCVRIANDALKRDRSPVAQVAVVIDERASWYLTLDRQLQRAICYENFTHSFDSIGAPVDLLMLSDLARADLGRYRAIFFLNCFALTAAERAQIDQLKRGGRTLVFYQAAGYIKPGAEKVFAVDHIRQLTGIELVETEMLFQMRITTAGGHPLLKGYENRSFGTHTEKPLSFYVADPQAERLGSFSGIGPTALALKRFDDWKSVYCGAPGLPAQIARNLIQEAGAHLYLDSDDIVYANRSYVGVFTRSGGTKHCMLPKPSVAEECFSNRKLAARPTMKLTWDAEQYHTYLFAIDDES